MSTIIMGRCWPLQVPPVAKSVLMSLADQANDQAVCWPAISTICERTCYGERAVQNAIRVLQEMGLLKVEIGAMKANRYTLILPVLSKPTPAPDAPVHDVHPRTTCTPPPHDVHPNRNRTISNTPPLPPTGGDPPPADADPGNPAVQPTAHGRKEPVTLRTWLQQCVDAGVKPIPPEDPVFRYTAKVGIGEDVLLLHWRVFKARYLDGLKRQADWRKKFRLSVEGNWYRLWYFGADGQAALTTQGIQAKRDQEGGGA